MVCDSLQDLELPLLDVSVDRSEPLYEPLPDQKCQGDVPESKHVVTPKTSLLLGAVFLVINTLAVGSLTPILAVLSTDGVILKFTWRFFTCMLTFSVFALRTKKENGEYWTLREMFFSQKTRIALVTASCWVIWMGTALYASLIYTFMIADMFSNMTSVFILVHRLATRVSVKRGEMIGVFIALLGAACTLLTPQESGHSKSDLIMAILIAGFGSVVGAIYLLTAERIGDSIPLDVLIFVNATYGFIITAVAAMAFEGAEFWSLSAANGVFGLFSSENLLMVPILSLVSGVCGIRVGFMAIQSVGSLVVSVTYLINPGIAAVETYLLGVNNLPCWSSIIATLIMSLGLLVLILSRRETETVKKETQPSLLREDFDDKSIDSI